MIFEQQITIIKSTDWVQKYSFEIRKNKISMPKIYISRKTIAHVMYYIL